MKRKHSLSRRRMFVKFGLALAGIGGISKFAAAATGIKPRKPHSLRAPFRRVVTGVNAAGQSFITSDGPVPRAAQWSFSAEEIAQSPYLRGISGNELWLFDSVPADASGRDPLLGKLPEGDEPARGGAIARIHRFEAGTAYPMHMTRTVDLVVIVSGEMELGLEQGSTIVGPGDVIVQNGTQHSWRVVGQQACVFVAVLFDAVRS